MRFAVMIEGQEDVTWDDWVALAQTCERLGFEALFRSDHYLSVMGGDDRGSLDAWGTLCGLAAITSTLRLGTLVSPATFRHPSVLAKNAVTADHISGGRVELGIGTGWMDAEHRAYGFPFPPMGERMDRLEEQLEIVRGSFGAGRFSFHGEHYAVEGLDALPKPVQDPPPLLMGGAAKRRGAALAARFADEYNVVHAAPDEAAASRSRLVAACERAGRDPATLRFSLMHQFLIGRDEAELRLRAERLADVTGGPADVEQLRRTALAGTPDEVVARLREYEAAGVERVMLQHLAHRDLEALELIAAEVVPAFA
jgi:F420-dependent oxidoreductase-like protein